MLKDKGYLATGGQMIDATIVSAPKERLAMSKDFEIFSTRRNFGQAADIGTLPMHVTALQYARRQSSAATHRPSAVPRP
jgi:hypothetical protein